MFWIHSIFEEISFPIQHQTTPTSAQFNRLNLYSTGA
jgi:hypothetical protein